jgi:microcystin-dependent protein
MEKVVQKKFASFASGIAFAFVLLGASKVLHADPPPSFAAGETLSAAKLNGALSSLSARLDAVEKAEAPVVATVPPGTIAAFAGSSIPAGWRLCDGSSVNRTDSAALFAAIGTSWGNGDGTTTFNVPDLRGRFLRGVDRGANRDPDRATRIGETPGQNVGDDVGSLQSDALDNHNHPYNHISATGIAYAPGGAGATVIMAAAGGTSAGVINANVSTETRPKNASVNYIIKE